MKFTFQFIARNVTPAIEIESNGEVVSEELVRLFEIFGTRTPTGFTVHARQSATPEVKEKIQSLALRLKKSAPALSGLSKFFQQLDDNEFFVVLNRRTRSTEEYLALSSYLEVINGRKTLDDCDHVAEFFGNLVSQYDVVAYDNTKRVRIGSKNPADKCCRFCFRTARMGAKFAHKAHAISESLGNKSVVLADECDDCNKFFGDLVEPSLTNFLNVQRVFLGIRGKGNEMPTIYYSNGTITHDGEKMVISSHGVSETAKGFQVQLGEGPSFVPQDCYRALVKFTLSTIEAEHLGSLKSAINWVRHAARPNGQDLPPVYWGLVPFDRKSSPSITVFVRKVPHDSLPHVVTEFRVGPFMFVYAVPFSTEDPGVQRNWFQVPAFTGTFSHYSAVTWEKIDFDSTEVQQLPTLLTMNQRTCEVDAAHSHNSS